MNPSLDLYFNLMYAEMDFAFTAGAETHVFGQTADDFKSRLGCHQERRYFYVAPTGRVAGLFLEPPVLPDAAGATAMGTHRVFRER